VPGNDNKKSNIASIEQADMDVAARHPVALGEPRFTEVREHVWSTLMDEAREAELKLEH